jgi:hypothetical protein
MYTKNKHQNKTLRKRAFYFGKRTTALIKAPQRYAVQEGDATMLPNANMPGQYCI